MSNNLEKQLPTTGSDNIPGLPVSLDQFKSFYYLLNAKPDSQIRLLQDNKSIEYEDLQELNGLVTAKLNTENVETSITTITIVFKNKKINSYKNWMEFSRTNWQISDQTLSVSISWDINLTLPEFKFPQKHTLKVRLGSHIRPNEVFQLIMLSDKDEEILEATSNGVCKIDFVNAVIANELLAIVDEWYSALPKNTTKSVFAETSEKYRRQIAFVFNSLIVVSAICLCYNVSMSFIGYRSIELLENGWFEKLTKAIAFSFAVIYMADILGKLLGTRIYSKLGEYNEHSIFRITKGDKNAIKNIDEKNAEIRNGILTQFMISFLVGLFCLLAGFIVDAVK
jgi:hypothetical protein